LDQLWDYFMGDFFPLTPYTTSEAAWFGYQFHDPTHDAGVAFIFRRSECPAAEFRFALSAINPRSVYYVAVDGAPPIINSGADLAAGTAVLIADRPGVAIIRYSPTELENR
jgi:alpha-galactosidase